MPDAFDQYQPELESPATRLFEIVPSDSGELVQPTRAICAATSGMIRVTTTDGDTADFYYAAGMCFPIRVTRVWQTGTEVTGIRGLA